MAGIREDLVIATDDGNWKRGHYFNFSAFTAGFFSRGNWEYKADGNTELIH